MQLTFHGAAGTVTGSRFLLEDGDTRILVDCGLFQGLKALRLRNWEKPPIEPQYLDAIVLTHAHIDHSGYLPLMVRKGFSGPIYCTEGTADLLQVLLPDAAYLQEEDARHANRYGYSKHHPAVPLYDRNDVQRTLPLLKPVAFDQDIRIGALTARYAPVGHILGAASVRVRGSAGTIGFSGDVGRLDDPLMRPPRTLEPVDWLVLESTYGNRTHDHTPVQDQLEAVVKRVMKRKGVLLVPAFAVGRSQAVLHRLELGMAAGRIPKVPVFLDSPMAINATEIFCKHVDLHRLTKGGCARMCDIATFVREPEGSKALDRRPGPMILIAASGMATGGRVLHHLKVFAPHPRNAILFCGYQAEGTRGEALVNGADEVKIHGAYVEVRAQVLALHGLSAHADWRELMTWLAPVPAPRQTFLVHGSPSSLDAMRVHLRDKLGWPATVANDGQTVQLVPQREPVH